MRSKKRIIIGTTISVGLKKRCVGLFFIACSLVCCPNFGLLAETIPSSNTYNHSLNVDSSTSPRIKIYFYDPEINTARNLVLKNTWDTYLYQFGSYEFQPVDSSNDFEQLVRNEENAAFIMAEWFYSSLFSSQDNDLELAFNGLLNGRDTYQKILVSHDNIIDLEKVTIACSGTKKRAKSVLRSIYPELSLSQIEKIKILLVPKDIDALMAVGYGLADMALSTEVGLSKMALLNQNIYKDMVVLKASKPLRRSVLIFKSSNKELKASLAYALMNMSKHPNGQQAINLLGLDEWKIVDSLSTLLPKNIMDDTHKNGGHNNDN
tara:strand:+ start:6298 stop:7260 length:963 start_codon:yes stop_codon:yes gene_type:complete